jgi:predicted enzyme related to lactoylglutathione lyase
MNRVVHFEIHGSNLDATQKFYQSVFGWEITDLGPQMGNYRMVNTGKDAAGATWPGINGGLVTRMGPAPQSDQPVNAFVCTIDVDNLDAYLEKVKNAAGSIALDKMQVPGVGWLAYVKDPEGNIFGMLQPEASRAGRD